MTCPHVSIDMARSSASAFVLLVALSSSVAVRTPRAATSTSFCASCGTPAIRE
jgi:hypothetical protein